MGYPPQGAGGALRPQRWEMVISEAPLAHDPTTYAEWATAWIEKKRVRMNFSGKIRTTFEMWTKDGVSAQEARIYRNGAAYSDVASTLSTTPVLFTLDTAGWVPGDVYSFRQHAVNYGYTGYTRNWRLQGTLFSLFDSAPFIIEL